MGLGAILFRPSGMTTIPMGGDASLSEASDFFADAFWTAKVGGGAKELSKTQRKSLVNRQMLDFQRRYSTNMGNNGKRAKLMLCRNGKGELMGCAGVEVDSVPTMSLTDGSKSIAPLMSNVAVGKKFRRRGVAEELVREVEAMVQKDWGFDECYLYVEKINVPAIRLYKKLGYREVWEDSKARTIVPTENGGVKNAPTVLVCMKKNLKSGPFGSLFRF